MSNRLNSDINFIKDRLAETIAVQTTIAADWIWGEMTLAQWETKQAQLYGTPASLMSVLAELEADVSMATSALINDLKKLHDATVTGVELARVRFRKDVEFMGVLGALSAGGRSRQAILDEAEEWALAWEELAPAWEAGMSLVDFEALRAVALASMRALRLAQVKMRRGAGRLRVLALEVEDLCQAWYAVAAAIFPADTVNGSIVRSIKTTSDRPRKRRRRKDEQPPVLPPPPAGPA